MRQHFLCSLPPYTPTQTLLRLPLHKQTLSLTARRLAIPHLPSLPHPIPPRLRHVPGRTPSIPTSLTHVLPTHAQPLPSLHSRHTHHQPTTQQPTPAMSSGQRHGSSSSIRTLLPTIRLPTVQPLLTLRIHPTHPPTDPFPTHSPNIHANHGHLHRRQHGGHLGGRQRTLLWLVWGEGGSGVLVRLYASAVHSLSFIRTKSLTSSCTPFPTLLNRLAETIPTAVRSGRPSTPTKSPSRPS